MTLPSSGQISLFAIADEFGLARSTSFPGGFYGRGGAPGGGQMSLMTFYARTSVSFLPAPSFLSVRGVGTAGVNLSCNVDAQWSWSASSKSGGGTSQSGTTSGRSVVISAAAAGDRGQATWVGTVTAQAGGVSATWDLDLYARGRLVQEEF